MMAQLKQDAVEAAATYRDIDAELTTSHEVAGALHGRYDEMGHELVEPGPPVVPDRPAHHGRRHRRADRRQRRAAAGRGHPGGLRRVGLDHRRPGAGQGRDFQAIADRYNALKDQVSGRSEQLLDRLAAQRSGAPWVRSRRPRPATSPSIRPAPRRVRRSPAPRSGAAVRPIVGAVPGRTVQGSGDFARTRGNRRDHLAVRAALPPDPALPQAAHRDGLRRRLGHPRRRRRPGADDRGQPATAT